MNFDTRPFMLAIFHRLGMLLNVSAKVVDWFRLVKPRRNGRVTRRSNIMRRTVFNARRGNRVRARISSGAARLTRKGEF